MVACAAVGQVGHFGKHPRMLSRLGLSPVSPSGLTAGSSPARPSSHEAPKAGFIPTDLEICQQLLQTGQIASS